MLCLSNQVWRTPSTHILILPNTSHSIEMVHHFTDNVSATAGIPPCLLPRCMHSLECTDACVSPRLLPLCCTFIPHTIGGQQRIADCYLMLLVAWICLFALPSSVIFQSTRLVESASDASGPKESRSRCKAFESPAA